VHALGLMTAPDGAAAASCPRGGFRWFAPGRAPHASLPGARGFHGTPHALSRAIEADIGSGMRVSPAVHALGLMTAPDGAAAASCPRGGFRWFAPGRAPHERATRFASRSERVSRNSARAQPCDRGRHWLRDEGESGDGGAVHALGLMTAPDGAAAASCPRGGFRWFAPGIPGARGFHGTPHALSRAIEADIGSGMRVSPAALAGTRQVETASANLTELAQALMALAERYRH
jgi:hypothetical protein